MTDQQPLELTLLEAFTDGMAYFKDSSGKLYFRSGEYEKPIRPLKHGKDDHPMMCQFCDSNPLAEKGRKFASPEEADKYVGALVDLDRLIILVQIANDSTEEKKNRELAYEVVTEIQEKGKKNLDILDSIPNFEKIRKYLFMKPEEIYADLKAQEKPKSEPTDMIF